MCKIIFSYSTADPGIKFYQQSTSMTLTYLLSLCFAAKYFLLHTLEGNVKSELPW